jgi:lactoylglutathione lyase
MTTESPVDERTAVEPLRAIALTVSLTVKDLARSTAWYRDVLGFAVDERHERDGKLRAVSLRAGDVRIVIGQDDGAKGWDRVKGEGFSVQFTTEQNIDAIAARIVDRGGSLADGPLDTPWGARVVRLIDPDGFKLTVASPRAR